MTPQEQYAAMLQMMQQMQAQQPAPPTPTPQAPAFAPPQATPPWQQAAAPTPAAAPTQDFFSSLRQHHTTTPIGNAPRDYFDRGMEGEFVAEVTKYETGVNRDGPFFSCEVRVLETSNPAVPVGSVKSVYFDTAPGSFSVGRFWRFVVNIANSLGANLDGSANANKEPIIQWLERAVKTQPQPLLGKRLLLRCVTKPKKTKPGETFTSVMAERVVTEPALGIRSVEPSAVQQQMQQALAGNPPQTATPPVDLTALFPFLQRPTT